MARNTNGAVAGGACVVTEGPNKGKRGTYTIDDDGNVWCEGDWGGTQCVSKCKDAKALHASVYEYVGADGKTVYEFDGLYDVDGLGIFRCVSRIDAASGASQIAVVPLAVTPLANLRDADSEMDRRLAVLIRSHIDGIVKDRTPAA